MRRPCAVSALVIGGLFVAGCSDQRSPLPTEPPISPSFTIPTSCPRPIELAALIGALFAPRDLLAFALQLHASINLKMSRGDLAGARKVVLEFIDFTVKSYYAGKLRDPNGANPPTTPEAVIRLIDGLLCWVGLPASGLVLGSPNAAGSPITTKVIGPGGGDLKATDAAGNGYAALRVPPGTVSEDRLWVITRRDGLAPQGCVTTDLEQVGLCIDFSVVPAQDLALPVRTVICQSNSNAGLQLAHQLAGGKVELLAFAADPFDLPCAHLELAPPGGLGRIGRAVWRFGSYLARVAGPPPAYAGHAGLGGLVAPKLSNITAVRVRLGFVTQPTSTEVGVAITPAVQVAFLKAGTRVIEADTAVTNPIRVGIGSDPSGGATLGGMRTQNPTRGVATFNGLTIDRAGTGYTLVADALSPTATGSVPLGIEATSTAFDVGSPDLVISSASPTVTPNPVVAGGTVGLSAWTIKNQGTGPVFNGTVVNVAYFLSTDATITRTDMFLGSTFVTSTGMAPGQENSGPALVFTVPAATTPGTYWIGILADQDNAATESNEVNNFVSTPLSITAPPTTTTITFETYSNEQATCGICGVTNDFATLGIEFQWESSTFPGTTATLADGVNSLYGDAGNTGNHFVMWSVNAEGQGQEGILTMQLPGNPQVVEFDWSTGDGTTAFPVTAFDAAGNAIPAAQISHTLLRTYTSVGNFSFKWERVRITSPTRIGGIVFNMNGFGQLIDNVVLNPTSEPIY
jgi:hypothetical protein